MIKIFAKLQKYFCKIVDIFHLSSDYIQGLFFRSIYTHTINNKIQ